MLGKPLSEVFRLTHPPEIFMQLLSTFKDYCRLILTLLTLQPFDFLAATVYLSLIPVNLLLLLIIDVLLSLQLIAD